jgi:uncharacterized protein
MMIYFLDSSAVIKHHFQEQGHRWVRSLHDPAQEHRLYISQAALVEVVATVCRKAREQNIPDEKRNMTIRNFRCDARNLYRVRLVNDTLYRAAGDLCRSHRLRAYDAVQLACAIAVRDDALAVRRLGVKRSDFIFVSGDRKLLETALAEGLMVENPDGYA